MKKGARLCLFFFFFFFEQTSKREQRIVSAAGASQPYISMVSLWIIRGKMSVSVCCEGLANTEQVGRFVWVDYDFATLREKRTKRMGNFVEHPRLLHPLYTKE